MGEIESCERIDIVKLGSPEIVACAIPIHRDGDGARRGASIILITFIK